MRRGHSRLERRHSPERVDNPITLDRLLQHDTGRVALPAVVWRPGDEDDRDRSHGRMDLLHCERPSAGRQFDIGQDDPCRMITRGDDRLLFVGPRPHPGNTVGYTRKLHHDQGR